MALSTETESLIDLYNQKIALDTKQLSQINVVQTGYIIKTGIGTTEQIKVWGPSEVIENYNVPIDKLDTKILEINSEIQNLQSQVLFWGQSANAVGCGTTTVPLVTVYEDVAKYQGYTFSGVNPFVEINGNLSGNIGIGTYNYIDEIPIGTYLGNVQTCYAITCSSGICAGYASSIANLQSQITVLQSDRDDLIGKVNFLKSARSQYELQNYAYEQSKVQLNNSISNSNTVISFLQDPANSEWL